MAELSAIQRRPKRLNIRAVMGYEKSAEVLTDEERDLLTLEYLTYFLAGQKPDLPEKESEPKCPPCKPKPKQD